MKRKTEQDIDGKITCTASQENQYDSNDECDVDSQASYIYNSEDSSIIDTEGGTEDERDYFGDSISIEESGESEAAWIDSDEDEDLREDYKETAPWITAEGPAINIQRKTKKISFKLSRNIFMTKYKIKLLKIYSDVSIAIDTFNILYFITNFNEYKAYKIDEFRICDVVCLNDRVILSSKHSSLLKVVLMNGESKTINKRTGYVQSMALADSLYIAGSQLYRFDRNLNLKDTFDQVFISICVSKEQVVGLKEDGDIFVFDLRLNFLKKHSFPGKFQFNSLYSTDSHYYIGTEAGFSILDRNFVLVKELMNIKAAPSGLVFNDDFTIYGSSHPGSLRIIKNGLVPYDRFPFSKVFIPPINALGFQGDTLYFTHSHFISALKIHYC
ncbi:hypothetical protein PAEPH01_0361 [Pancytospora epiphaga]|nr:hypothetical protein PAEPH01_0361 [Pancytospora epiphaga]